MSRAWRILTSKRPTTELLGWAADSKIGAVCVVLIWIGIHVVLGYASGNGPNVGRSDLGRFLFWCEIWAGVLGVVFVDTMIAWDIFKTSRPKKPNKAPEPTPTSV